MLNIKKEKKKKKQEKKKLIYLLSILLNVTLPEIDETQGCSMGSAIVDKYDTEKAGVVTTDIKKQRECEALNGLYYEETFVMKKTGDCETFRTCFLPMTSEIKDISKCIKLDDKNIHCSLSFTDLQIPDNYSFMESVELLNTFYLSLNYKPATTSEINPTKTISSSSTSTFTSSSTLTSITSQNTPLPTGQNTSDTTGQIPSKTTSIVKPTPIDNR